ncbi:MULTISPECIES: carbonic anhydrase [unclassified Campylobacter]|uniref:carbonic anhydrase n=1 Tax=unclassified Campylobacter TaxID=2593542 RepID=UPI001237C4C5|nr:MULTISPECIES: carbonic anhydrase [unclassified Campylobacter]KAA6225070.1 carbonic anhydrase [Campylobacter sp. LR196d]KAA6226083.1 carbonic anhydrase [Campylobacter sp. LR185c]KAA6228029.1 carbonic anhydrase [Campylobacter sp. LR286c]KAA6231284.1 carbonic anhydrase [Campylobacter sp. LR264d]KAA6231495.1 carbonic anhydrase [Campylobacter sp. LR291e]
MQNLISGAIKFMQEDFKEHEQLFESLKNRQNPHTLFIGCSDSRVIPNLITNTGPGELFVIRNIANIVPPYRVGDDYLATTSAIEYALNSLHIENIVVCGHSNCGGCNALYSSDEELKELPNVKKWLTMLEPIKHDVLSFAKDDIAMRSWLTEKLNLVNSLQNILTYPGVLKALEDKKIEIHAWYYIIETGEIYEYDYKRQIFTLIQNRNVK